MGSLGWHNPFPVEYGGGETLVEGLYLALRSAEGTGGSAPDDDLSVDGLWRSVKARAIASVASSGERAALQAFPDRATDALAYYERLTGLTPSPDQSDQERRERSAVRFAGQQRADLPALEQSLQRIDSRISLLSPSHAEAVTTVHGRAFEDLAATLPFGGGRMSTAFPNYSTDFVLYVLMELGDGAQPNAAERQALADVAELCAEVLPAWNNFSVATHRGFKLDVSRLDLTGLT